jgi:cytochrome P450
MQLGYHPFTHILRWLLFKTRLGRLLGGKAFRENKRFRAFCSQALRERREAEELAQKSKAAPSKDFFHYLLNCRDPATGLGYAKGELESESVLLVVAGSDAASAALAGSFFYLIRNKEALKKLTSEIRSTFSSADDIRYSNSGLGALPYLRACIDETLRMTPPTPGHLPREVLADGLIVEDSFFPRGTIVGVSAYALHHNEQYFPDPFKFYPERWLVDSDSGVTPESVAAAQSAFCPFSVGTRGCIGKQMAYMELSLALAKVLWLYDIRAKPGDKTGEGSLEKQSTGRHNDEFHLTDVFVAKTEGPVIELRVR